MGNTTTRAQRYNNRMNKIWRAYYKQQQQQQQQEHKRYLQQQRYYAVDRGDGLFVVGPFQHGHRIKPTDCVWLVPGTIDCEYQSRISARLPPPNLS